VKRADIEDRGRPTAPRVDNAVEKGAFAIEGGVTITVIQADQGEVVHSPIQTLEPSPPICPADNPINDIDRRGLDPTPRTSSAVAVAGMGGL
jgi:hypothetical protein